MLKSSVKKKKPKGVSIVVGSHRRRIMGDAPECYGKQLRRGLDDKCAVCEWLDSCHYFSNSKAGERSRDVHYRSFQAMPFSKAKGKDVEQAMENAYDTGKRSFFMPNGKEVDISEVNVDLVKICIWLTLEWPETMRAFALKLDPRVKSLDDMAVILNTSRQLLHQHIAKECGVGSHPKRAKKSAQPKEEETPQQQQEGTKNE